MQVKLRSCRPGFVADRPGIVLVVGWYNVPRRLRSAIRRCRNSMAQVGQRRKMLCTGRGKIMLQLWHVGMPRELGSAPNREVLPVGPSGLSEPGVQIVEPMTDIDIEASDCRLC